MTPTPDFGSLQTETSIDIARRTFLSQLAHVGAAGWLLTRSDVRAWSADRKPGQLIVHTELPMNAEPPLDQLVQSWVTPAEAFYIRNHGPQPEVGADSFRLKVEGLVDRELSLSLGELEGHARVEAAATLTCAGNRRAEHIRVRPMKGVPWREGAVGNANWSGLRLSDLLKKAGLKEGARHVWFEGLDRIEHGGGVIPFGGSIPIEKALLDTDKMPGAIVATHMNDEPLTPEHGWPVRTIVPGYIGARSVKWLGRIVVSDRPSPNHYVAEAYKLIGHDDPLEIAETAPIYRYPINAVICTPAAGSKHKAGRMAVAGYALPPGDPGATIARIELSADGGRTWTAARITTPNQEYCWCLWTAEVSVTPASKELIVRAFDSRGRTQPQQVDWNAKGYLFNAWHHSPVAVSSL